MVRRRPRWMTDEQWRGYLQQVAQENACLLTILRRELAEARADLDADRDTPELHQAHAARISILLCQIADADGTAPYKQEPARPRIVNAKKPRTRKHHQVENPLLPPPS